jgi:cytochrome P450
MASLSASKLKVLKGTPILGHLLPYLSNPWVFVNKITESNGSRVQLKMLNKTVFLLSNPADITDVLQNHAEHFTKGRTFKKLKLLLGEGLITSEGSLWRRQNKMMRPVFSIKNILNQKDVIQQVVQKHCRWETGQVIDVHHEMNKVTLNIIAQTLFDIDLSAQAALLLQDVEDMMHFLMGRVRSVMSLPLWVPLPAHKKFLNAKRRFDDLVYRMIKERRESGVKKNDLLQLLLDTRSDDSQAMGDQQIRDEIITILMAGHETITNSMTWALILLCQNPSYQKLLADEVKDWKQGTEGDLFFSQQNLHQCVMDESMRLWPPVWAFMRQCQTPIKVGEIQFNPNDLVFLMPFFAHRSSSFWEKAQDFFPERFYAKTQITPGSYLPFGLGPRMCIGKMFAQVEAKILLSFLMENYRFELIDPQPQKVEAGITLRPLNNTQMRIKKCT